MYNPPQTSAHHTISAFVSNNNSSMNVEVCTTAVMPKVLFGWDCQMHNYTGTAVPTYTLGEKRNNKHKVKLEKQALTECEAFLTARLSSDSDFDCHLQVTSTKSVALACASTQMRHL